MAISKEMTLGQIMRADPKAAGKLRGYGMGCMGCPASSAETLEEASMVHGIDIDELLESLNDEGDVK